MEAHIRDLPLAYHSASDLARPITVKASISIKKDLCDFKYFSSKFLLLQSDQRKGILSILNHLNKNIN
jgi:hypothetical protein